MYHAFVSNGGQEYNKYFELKSIKNCALLDGSNVLFSIIQYVSQHDILQQIIGLHIMG